ncbi:hypothetical protein C8A03DRAFT_40227 [Achaetomium macrosporum]|uniref:Synaptobrevin n=1 Tax=Achaetomium macrosporum TaxID=79813 RepID=A0AAN7CJF7_9PEZI|nr:hypothetical protein C8A03DRAFT_40227 [Achaetomium macrosporum]
MARLIHGVPVTPIPRRTEPLTDLALLLNRLQRTILHADAEREARLRESEFERDKARANVNYARSLLTKLEQEAVAVKIVARRQETQAELVRKRELLDQISGRLSDLAEFAAAAGHGNGTVEEDTSDGEDILADIIATPSESMNSSRSPNMPPEEPNEAPSDQAAEPPEPPSPPSPSQPQKEHDASPLPEQGTTPIARQPTTSTTTTTYQTLRSRQPESTPPPTQPQKFPPSHHNQQQPQATTTSSSLFSHHPTTASTASHTTDLTAISTTEAILDHQRAEQDALSESILKLAAQLKASSQAFSASLEEDKEVVERAGRGMSKTSDNMEGVSRKMGMLTRMTEGEGWLGRMRLYVMVYGLMGILLVVVFGLPKLRF